MLSACSFDPGAGLPDESEPIDNDPGPGSPDAAIQAPMPTAMFAGNESQLWTLDRDTMATELIGNFTAVTVDSVSFRCGGIALSSDGTLYAVTVDPPSTLYTVDPSTAALSNPRTLTNSDAVWGTTMVPAGTPASFSTETEMLMIGGPNGELYAVDPADGKTTFVGDFGGSWRVSGDLAFVEGVGLMGTLDAGGNDRLAVISLSDASVTELGDTGRGDVYGLASVDGRLWGLTGNNVIYEMNTSTASVMSQTTGPTNWSIAAP